MVRTGLGGGIPGRRSGDDETDGGGTVDAGTVNIADEISDDGGSSSSSSDDSSSSSSGGSSSLRDRVRDSLGGDPVDSGGVNSSDSSSSSGGSSQNTRDPQRGPSGPPNSRQSGGGSLTDQGLGQADALNEQVSNEQSRPPRTDGALDNLAEQYTENVAEPAGELVADATPAARAEEAVFGTNRTERFIEGTTETLAQAGNVPGALAGARDLGQTFVQARRRASDPVTIGGVPTGVTVPNLEGQEQNARAAGGFAAAAAQSASNNPFRTAGSVFGGVVGGSVAGRKVGQVSRRAGGADTVEEFFADRRGTTTGRQLTRGETDSSSTTIDADDIDPRQTEPDQGPSAFPDPQGRFQGGAGFNRNNPARGDDGPNPAAVEPSGGGDGFGYRSVSSEVRTAQRPPDADSPLGPDLRNTVEFEDPSTESVFGSADAAGAGSAAGASGSGSSLGELDEANDPTSIDPTGTFTAGTAVSTAPTGTGTGSETGTLNQVNDPSDVFGTPGSLGGGSQSDAAGTDTGLGNLDATNDPAGTASGTDVFADSGVGAPTDTRTGVGTAPGQDTPPLQDTPPVQGTPAITDTPPVFETTQTPTTRTPTRTPTPIGGGFDRGGFDFTPRRFDVGSQNDAGGSTSSTSSTSDTFGTGFADPEDLFASRDAEEEEEVFGNNDNDDSGVFSGSNLF